MNTLSHLVRHLYSVVAFVLFFYLFAALSSLHVVSFETVDGGHIVDS